jgi:hypothetical protein
VVKIPSPVRVPVGLSFLSVIVGRDSLGEGGSSNNPWHYSPFDHLKLVPHLRGLGRLQAKGTLELCPIDRCNSFGLCSSNAVGNSSPRCSLRWTRFDWIEIVTSLQLQVRQESCYMQRTGNGGTGKARQLKVFGRANQDSRKGV